MTIWGPGAAQRGPKSEIFWAWWFFYLKLNILCKYEVSTIENKIFKILTILGDPLGKIEALNQNSASNIFFCLGLRYWFLQNHKHYQKSDGGDRFYHFRTFRGPAHFWGPKSKICSQHFFTPKWGYMLMKLLFHNFKIGGGDRFLNFGLFRALDPN